MRVPFASLPCIATLRRFTMIYHFSLNWEEHWVSRCRGRCHFAYPLIPHANSIRLSAVWRHLGVRERRANKWLGRRTWSPRASLG